ncbi:MAG: ABC transporter ATP-binding protein [Pseudomonadota bacterium]
MTPSLEVNHLSINFRMKKGWFNRDGYNVAAVRDVSFNIGRGETLGLVGESGSGKSSIARALLKLIPYQSGSIIVKGADISRSDTRIMDFRRDLQVVFQDPYSSLNPSMVAGDIIGEPLQIHFGLKGSERDKRVISLMEQVGLAAYQMERYPSEFSGGQRQRIAIARALALQPELIICDEAISALDVSTQSQVINLLEDLQQRLKLSYLFIAHDLAVVRYISDRIAVLYLGELMEIGPADQVCDDPKHPYTRFLLSAIPSIDPDIQKERKRVRQQTSVSEITSNANQLQGCPFHPRCPEATDLCSRQLPEPTVLTEETSVRCHLYNLVE